MTQESFEAMRLAARSDRRQARRTTGSTADSPASTTALRFGQFEFDPRSGELRKQGRRIRLEGQPVRFWPGCSKFRENW